jgi:TRAP-type C4-dicarboxylate transport system permease small subunit
MSAERGEGDGRPAGPLAGFMERATIGLAVAGGAILIAFAALVTVSVVRRWLTSQGIPGDFELVQLGLAIAVFAFLPLGQLRNSNIFVDTFTARAPRWVQSGLDLLWTFTYFLIAALITWRMMIGAFETMRSGTTTMVLGVPTGWAILVSALLAAWLVIVTLFTVIRLIQSLSR